MSWVPAEKVLQVVASQRQIIADQNARIAAFQHRHSAEHQKLTEERHAAARDLGQALLPRLDAPSIAAAAHAVGMVGLPGEDIPAKLEGWRATLAARLTAILAEPRFVQRELLRHPRTGSLVTALNEALEYRRITSHVVDTCESHGRFERLWTTGYGTPEEAASWWRYSYWQDRAAARELCATLGKATFAEVRDDYARQKETVNVYDAEIARLRGEIAAGERLDQEYATLWDEHRTLDSRGLEHTRNRLVQHVLGSDASQMQHHLRASSSPSLLLFLRASGLSAKVSYLDGLQRKTIDEMQRELTTQLERLDRAEAKTRKRWAAMPLDRFQKLSEDRRGRYEKRWQRFDKVYVTVHDYDRWDRARYYDDLLWWDVMTRGRYDGSYLPEVATFHAAHPDYHFESDWKSLAASYEYEDASWHTAHDADDANAAAAAIDADVASGGERDGGDDWSEGASDGGDGGGDDLQTTDAS